MNYSRNLPLVLGQTVKPCAQAQTNANLYYTVGVSEERQRHAKPVGRRKLVHVQRAARGGRDRGDALRLAKIRYLAETEGD